MKTSRSFLQAFFPTDPDRDAKWKAFDAALDTRKLEIGLFWNRALFFWGFIAAAFVYYGAAIGQLYSRSNVRRSLFDQTDAFETDLRKALLTYDPTGTFHEIAQFGYLLARRP